MIISDDSLDDSDNYDADAEGEAEDETDLGFISTQKNTRRNIRHNIEEMLEARRLQKSMKEVFDDDY
ncbi:PA3496 family putative envelope integrity protein [Neptunomonas sp.]